ncbi:MAG TPA: sialidase family protein [Clostridia bacterium]|nr:sialidase family protein [Clostridia bacterium]
MKQVREMVFEDKPTKNCHASTVLPLENGEVVASWFGGTKEGNNDVDIWVSVRDENGWNNPQRISADKNLPHWNPVLLKRNDEVIQLFFKVGKKISFWQTYYSLSNDNGKTWLSPKPLIENDMSGGRGPVKNKCIRLSDGRLLAPASTEQDNVWKAFVDISFDDGATWERQNDISQATHEGKTVNIIQPTLWESEPGKVSMLIRSNCGRAYRSDSIDFGETWCTVYRTDVKNNNSGLDLVSLKDGTLYLVSNPVEENWGERAPLTLMKSTDNGITWEEVLCLEKLNNKDDEFSYPAIEAVGNTLYITYTWHREKIVFWKIEL